MAAPMTTCATCGTNRITRLFPVCPICSGKYDPQGGSAMPVLRGDGSPEGEHWAYDDEMIPPYDEDDRAWCDLCHEYHS